MLNLGFILRYFVNRAPDMLQMHPKVRSSVLMQLAKLPIQNPIENCVIFAHEQLGRSPKTDLLINLAPIQHIFITIVQISSSAERAITSNHIKAVVWVKQARGDLTM